MPYSRSCLFCDKRFTAQLERRLFCSDSCRVRYNREEHLRCFYCAELATSRDHIYPQTVRLVKGFANQEVVNCCEECNSLCGVEHWDDLQERIRSLVTKLKKRYGLGNVVPEWTDREVTALGPNLRSAVKGKIRLRQRAVERVLHAQGVLQMLDRTEEEERGATTLAELEERAPRKEAPEPKIRTKAEELKKLGSGKLAALMRDFAIEGMEIEDE